jgi:ABC-type multidrug transport system fused ATPase/permease subunit
VKSPSRSPKLLGVVLEFVITLGRYYRFFHTYAGRRILALIAIALVGSWVEAIGIALFFPVLSPGAPAGSLAHSIERAVDLLGLPPGLPGTLLLIVLAFTLKGLFLFLGGAYQYAVSSDVTRRIRERIVSAVRGAEYRYLVGTSSGQLTSVMTGEVGRTSTSFVFYSKVFPHLINMGVFFVVILVLEWRMTVLVGAAGIAVMLLVRIPARLSYRESRAVSGENGALASSMVQTVQNARYLLSTASFDRLEARIVASARRLARAEHRIGTLYSLSTALAQPLVVLLLAGVLFYYAALRAQSLAPAFVVMMYLYRILTEIFAMQTDWQYFCALAGGLDTVERTIRELEENRARPGREPFDGLRQGIELRGVSFAYQGGPVVVSDLELRVKRNRTVALVGTSGAGKSTVVDLLTGLLEPQSGEVLADARNLSSIDPGQFRRVIGYVPQEAMLFDDTVANNICLWSADPARPEVLARIREAAQRAHCDEFIRAMPEGYASRIGDRGIKLSGGQRQRLSIARELFKAPEILILDEATSALDSESEALIQASIQSLRGTMTILVIAHRLSTVRSCDHVYVLEKGRLAEDGGFQELLARPSSRLRRMCELQELL